MDALAAAVQAAAAAVKLDPSSDNMRTLEAALADLRDHRRQQAGNVVDLRAARVNHGG